MYAYGVYRNTSELSRMMAMLSEFEAAINSRPWHYRTHYQTEGLP